MNCVNAAVEPSCSQETSFWRWALAIAAAASEPGTASQLGCGSSPTTLSSPRTAPSESNTIRLVSRWLAISQPHTGVVAGWSFDLTESSAADSQRSSSRAGCVIRGRRQMSNAPVCRCVGYSRLGAIVGPPDGIATSRTWPSASRTRSRSICSAPARSGWNPPTGIGAPRLAVPTHSPTCSDSATASGSNTRSCACCTRVSRASLKPLSACESTAVARVSQSVSGCSSSGGTLPEPRNARACAASVCVARAVSTSHRVVGQRRTPSSWSHARDELDEPPAGSVAASVTSSGA